MTQDDWRTTTLNHLRQIILSADPSITEETKWVKPSNPAGVPTFVSNGIICTAETYKATVKLTFAKGASLDDPAGLFNASLEGNTRRAIDVREGDAIDADGLTQLVQAAVRSNTRR